MATESLAATTPALPAGLRDGVAARAAAVDAGAESPRRALEELASADLLALGAPGQAGTVADMAVVLADLAEVCLPTAFCAWGHRMAIEYLAPAGRPVVDDLLVMRRPGGSAMAAAFKAHLGLEPLPVTARREGDDLVLDGSIAWASNLHDDAVAVLAAGLEGGGEAIVALPIATPGVRVRPARGLLALDATASGGIRLEGVRVGTEAVYDEPLAAFVARVRRPFLVLQTAFCLGLARAALVAVESGLVGLGRELAEDAAALADTRDDVERRLSDLAERTDAPMRDVVSLRLDAAVLAREAVRVEAAVAGGRGYVGSSPTGRRLREAAFLPVQSPSEGQLRWELRQSA
ncbi:MAG: Butyryl-CoA dehydrogenase [uncultured Thermoleophilia bacterium]|uniref:Butyryl-CoA dehydrogenase n=1 Tax=uncultured Thermoleophilia bacterium TaxID=1497501 RepID=A0A6J4TV18_9ACTN|nr:MAG: Butyryl-CoA dehydrogenase [uncultured Thermoleophilia bacterium]